MFYLREIWGYLLGWIRFFYCSGSGYIDLLVYRGTFLGRGGLLIGWGFDKFLVNLEYVK